MNDSLSGLRTPLQVANFRSSQLAKKNLPSGIVVDVACGGGVPLISTVLATNKIGLGIELDFERAKIATRNVKESGVNAKIHCSDALMGLPSDISQPVSILLFDPERPRQGSRSHLQSLNPPVESVMKIWSKFLEQDSAVLIDVPPRFSDTDRNQLKKSINSILPKHLSTWEFLSRGGSRVDRLMLHLGPTACLEQHRCVRLNQDNSFVQIEGNPTNPPLCSSSWPKNGDLLVVLDAVIGASKLWDSWAKSYKGVQWLRTTGRRPIAQITNGPLFSDSFCVSSGIVKKVIDYDGENIPVDLFIDTIINEKIGEIRLRASIPPEIQPTLQRNLGKHLVKGGSNGVLIDLRINEKTAFLLLEEVSRATFDS